MTKIENIWKIYNTHFLPYTNHIQSQVLCSAWLLSTRQCYTIMILNNEPVNHNQSIKLINSLIPLWKIDIRLHRKCSKKGKIFHILKFSWISVHSLVRISLLLGFLIRPGFSLCVRLTVELHAGWPNPDLAPR